MSNEADTCRRFVVPRLLAVGWDSEPHRLNEQVTFTDGRIVVAGQKGRRRAGNLCLADQSKHIHRVDTLLQVSAHLGRNDGGVRLPEDAIRQEERKNVA
jgi:hypothetical protein